MAEPQKLLMIVAGETSGDMRAGEVIDSLRAIAPSLRFTGVGGERMAKAGVKLFADITQLAVIGFVEVIQHYGRIKKVFDQVLAEVDRTKPDAVLLVDYPGFNLRLARKLKEKKIKVIYYISPQVWAWKEKRVKTIKKVVDKMLVLFSFEREFYKKHKMDVEYVGHPLVDEVVCTKKPVDILKSLKLDPQKQTIGLLPGSRTKEISRHLPVMIKAANILFKINPNLQFLLMLAPSLPEDCLRHMPTMQFPVGIINDDACNGINACSTCIVSSGTATLETAILKKPMVIIYKTSWITYAIAKIFIKIPNIGLANIVAGKKIVPELVQNNANPKKIAAEMQKLLSDPKEFNRVQKELSKIHNWLGDPGASRRAAKVILKEIA